MADETQDGQEQDAAPAETIPVWLYIGAGAHLAGLPGADLTAADLAAHGYTPAQVGEHPTLYIPPANGPGQAALRVARAEAEVAACRAAWDAVTDQATEAEEGGPIWQALNAAEAALAALTAPSDARPPETDHPKVDAPATGPALRPQRGRPGAFTLPAAVADPAPTDLPVAPVPAVAADPPAALALPVAPPVEPPAPEPVSPPEPPPEPDAPPAIAHATGPLPAIDLELVPPAPVGEEPAPAPLTGEEAPPDDRRE